LINFEDLGLNQSMLRALNAADYRTATPIQEQAIPLLLNGHDLMGCAQTGTGKTAAFALPTLQRLAPDASQQHEPTPKVLKNGTRPVGSSTRPTPIRQQASTVRALVIAPTRELAAQIEQSFVTYGKFVRLRVAVIHGGVSQSPQVRALQRGVDILVATPGRLLDLMNQRYVDLSKVEILILDEADQMFDMGFLPDLRRIVAKVPKERQTLMFSATMPAEIREQANQWLQNPKYIEVAKVSSASAQVSHSVFHVSAQNKPTLLTTYLSNCADTRTIVFTRTKHGADKLVKVLCKSGFDAVAIHGNKSQNARTRHLEQFKSNRPPILVATDIAARGIDVNGVSHVINYDLPQVPELYVHRIGRTGRADATGTAVSFCCPDDRSYLQRIERLLNSPIDVNTAHKELTLSSASSSRNLRSEEKQPSRTRAQSSRNSRSGNRSRNSASTVRQRTPQGAGQSTNQVNPTSDTTASSRPQSNRRRKPRPRPAGDLVLN
jgi:ATP-dependent RNA helicase RhlE